MKVGRKKGQSGARVKRTGRTASYHISGNYEKYKSLFDYLDSCANIQGKGLAAIAEGIARIREEENETIVIHTLVHEFHEWQVEVRRILSGVKIENGRIEADPETCSGLSDLQEALLS
jgi:hypothetical protein